MQARNQSYLRRKNKEDIIRLLREQSRSYSDIARVLQLSNTACQDSRRPDGRRAYNASERYQGKKGHYSENQCGLRLRYSG